MQEVGSAILYRSRKELDSWSRTIAQGLSDDMFR